jgi:hypothetical protein
MRLLRELSRRNSELTAKQNVFVRVVATVVVAVTPERVVDTLVDCATRRVALLTLGRHVVAFAI